VSSSC